MSADTPNLTTELPDDVEGAAVTFDAHVLESREDLVSAGFVLVRYMTELRAEVEDLKAERDDALAETATAIADGKEEAARLRERVAEVERERDDARIHELHALARVASPGGDGASAFARALADKRGWGYLYGGGTPTGATPSEPGGES